MFVKDAPPCIISFSQALTYRVWLPRHSWDYLLKLLKILRLYAVRPPKMLAKLKQLTGSHVSHKLFKFINFKVLLLQNFYYSRKLNAMQASCKLRAEIVKRFIILT